MCTRTSCGLMLIVILAFSAVWVGEQATGQEPVASTGARISHLAVGSMDVEAVVNTDDSETIAAVLALLSREHISVLKRGVVLNVKDPELALKIAKASGLDTSNPATTEGGLLLADCNLTLGQLKCCLGGYVECCCPKKKEQ